MTVRRVSSRALRVSGVLVLLLATLALPAGTALADAGLVKAAPAPGSAVSGDLASVTVVFRQRLDASGSTVRVIAADGTPVDRGDVRVEFVDGVGTMRVSLRRGLRPGRYVVSWRSVAAEDGSTLADSFAFTVTPFLRSSPARGAELRELPETVCVTFSERLAPDGSAMVVLGPDAPVRADRGDGILDAGDPEGRTLCTLLRPGLGPGRYLVRWTATLAQGGEAISDTFGFTVRGEWTDAVAASGASSAGVPLAALPRAGGPPLVWAVALGLGLLGAGLVLRQRGQ